MNSAQIQILCCTFVMCWVLMFLFVIESERWAKSQAKVEAMEKKVAQLESAKDEDLAKRMAAILRKVK